MVACSGDSPDRHGVTGAVPPRGGSRVRPAVLPWCSRSRAWPRRHSWRVYRQCREAGEDPPPAAAVARSPGRSAVRPARRRPGRTGGGGSAI